MSMRNLAKNLYHTAENFISAIGVSNTLPNPEEARKTLLAFSPDRGGGCYLEKERFHKDNKPVCELSIIVPVYNVEKYLDACIRSILEQKTTVTYELILVNDGSPDGSRAIMATYENDPRVVLLDRENGGLSAARNTGLDRVQGAYIMFVDSDDSLRPGALESLMQCAKAQGADVVAGAYAVDKNGRFSMGPSLKNGPADPRTLYGMSWGKVFKREIFNHLNFPDKYWHQDSIFAQIVWPMCQSCYTVSDCVYNYRDNSMGITRTAERKPKALDSLYITERLLGERGKYGLTIEPADFDYFLHMVELTRYRTRLLPENIRKCIFVIQCELYQQYFSGFSTEKHKKAKKALDLKSFRRYLLM